MGREIGRASQKKLGRVARCNRRKVHDTTQFGTVFRTIDRGHTPCVRRCEQTRGLGSSLCSGRARKRYDSRLGVGEVTTRQAEPHHTSTETRRCTYGDQSRADVERALDTVNVSSVHCWSDSTVALYWINGQGEYRQFVSNRVAKIKDHVRVQWHYVSSEENPADLGSRGSRCVDSKLWRHGPDWLSDQSK